MDTRITKPSHRWLKAPTVHRTALPIRFEVSGASNEGREPETRYRMAHWSITSTVNRLDDGPARRARTRHIMPRMCVDAVRRVVRDT